MAQLASMLNPKFQFISPSGPLSGGKVYTCVPGGSIANLKVTYTDSTGTSQNANPVILDSYGAASIWGTGFYKMILQDSAGNVVATVDNWSNQYSLTGSLVEFVPQTGVSTYISATQFSTVSDATASLLVNRRIQAFVTAGTIYGTITAAVYAAGITTVTVAWDSGTLDSGLSSIAVGIITPTTASPLYLGSLPQGSVALLGIGIITTIGSPASMTNLSDYLNHVSSSGVTDGGALTTGAGVVNLTAATASLKKSLLITALTQAAGIATCTTSVAHLYNVGERVSIQGVTTAGYNGTGLIILSTPLTTTFTFAVVSTITSPAVITASTYAVNEHSQLYICVVPAINNLAVADLSTNYIYADYGLGTPAYGITTDLTAIDGMARSLIYIVARQGTSYWVVDVRDTLVDGNNKTNSEMREREDFTHVDGGTAITATGTRNIAVTAGAFYNGLAKIKHLAFDTSNGTDKFTTAYQINGVWTYTAAQAQIDNLQYNNTASGLAALTGGNYGVHWVYIMNGSPSTLLVVYGVGDYTLDLAFSAPPPALSNVIAGVGEIIGKIIIAQNGSSFYAIQSAFVDNFPILSLQHNNLTGFQGGQAGQYFHATTAEYSGAGVGTGNLARLVSPQFTTPNIGAATAASINGNTITAGSGALTLAAAKTLSVNKTLTLDGTDSTTQTFPSTSQSIAGLGVTQAWTKSQSGTPAALTVSANAVAVDLSLGNNFSLTLQATTSQVLSNPSNAVAGTSGNIAITQNATPSTLTFGSQWIEASAGVAAAVSTTALAQNLLSFYVFDSTHIYYILNTHGVA